MWDAKITSIKILSTNCGKYVLTTLRRSASEDTAHFKNRSKSVTIEDLSKEPVNSSITSNQCQSVVADKDMNIELASNSYSTNN